ncbi:hypothetical protein [Methanoculleus chikugoensis]|uniref:hypothetical protein n=1 Tax=Methanoculleus chikugoensis TaxID=118126 RepID=UPI001FB1BB55|nr:hypothetical protein [Methanoculleus chikugoensis]
MAYEYGPLSRPLKETLAALQEGSCASTAWSTCLRTGVRPGDRGGSGGYGDGAGRPAAWRSRPLV